MSNSLKNIRFVLFIILFFLYFFNSAEAGFTITDMTGRKVNFADTPKRIICISPGTLRLIIYLEAKKNIVGVEDMEKQNPATRPYWFANSELSSMPSIGPGGPATINKEPDIEKVLAVRPDAIFITYQSRENAGLLQKKTGIPVIVLSYGPFGSFNEDVFKSIRLAGRILNKEARANAVVDFFENARKDLSSRIKGIPKNTKTIYVGGIGFKGTHGIESTETSYTPLDWVNGNNIVKSLGKEGHLFLDKEKILNLNPDIIFMDSGGNELVRQDYIKKPDFYNGLKAFKNRQVFLMHSFNWYMTNLGTVVADAYAAGKILYPDRFKDVNPAIKADEIYKFLVGKPVYKDMAKSFGNLGETPDYIK